MAGKPLKVLYLIDSLNSGGAQRQMAYLLAGIDRRRVTPTLALYYPFFHFADEALANGVPLIMLGEHGGKDPRVLLRLNQLLRRQRFDLVHTMLRTPGQLTRMAALMPSALRQVPIIVSELDVFLGRSKPRLWLERALCRRGAAMIVNSERTQTHVEQLVPDWRGRVHLIPNGVRLDPLSPLEQQQRRQLRARCTADGTRLIGVVARIDHNKGPDLLAAALRRLDPTIAAGLSVAWIGNPLEQQSTELLRQLSQFPGSLARFTLLPPAANTRPFIAALDGLLLASRAESMPNVVFEGYAQSRPVIATDVGDIAQLVASGETGWLVPADNAAALATAITEFAHSEHSKLARMGRQGHRRIETDYSLAQMCERTLAVYQQLIHPPGSASRPPPN